MRSRNTVTKPKIEIIDIHLMALYAHLITGVLKVPSLQLTYEAMSYQERKMHAGQTNFEETFSVPPGLTSVMVFSREKLSNLQFDNGQLRRRAAATSRTSRA